MNTLTWRVSGASNYSPVSVKQQPLQKGVSSGSSSSSSGGDEGGGGGGGGGC